LIPGSPPVSLLQSDACPPTATFTRGPSSNQEVNGNQTLATPSRDPLTCPNPVNPHKEATNRILPNDAPTLSFATWNANGLLTAEGLPETRRKAKKRALNKLLHDNDAVAVQETHGQSEHWATTRKQLDKSHKIFHSHDPESRNKAGVALFLKRKLYRQAFREEVVEVNPGRTLTVRLFFAKGCLSFTSIHNFEMNETAQRQTAKHCADENRNAQNDEQGSSIHLIGGDFNFLARGEIPTRVSTKDLEIPLKYNDTRATNQSNIKWSTMLANSMEHHQPNKTRIGHNPNANENPETHYLIAKRIDRIYSSILPWQAINLKIKSYTTIDVTKAETQFGSDHAPVATKVTVKRQIPRDQRPIPHWLAKHPIYAETLQSILENDKHELIEDPFSRIEAIKQAMRRTSKNPQESPVQRSPLSREPPPIRSPSGQGCGLQRRQNGQNPHEKPSPHWETHRDKPRRRRCHDMPPPVPRMRLENCQRANRETDQRK
jgi:exonuclease III